jgi:hypothetical protein
VYVFPVVAPATVIGLALPVPERTTPPFADEHVALYPVIALPPLLAGALNDTVNGPVVADAPPVTADTAVGAPGAFATVAEFDALDGALLPTAFVAET